MPQPVCGQAGSTTPSSGLRLVAHVFLPHGYTEVKGTEFNPMPYTLLLASLPWPSKESKGLFSQGVGQLYFVY